MFFCYLCFSTGFTHTHIVQHNQQSTIVVTELFPAPLGPLYRTALETHKTLFFFLRWTTAQSETMLDLNKLTVFLTFCCVWVVT